VRHFVLGHLRIQIAVSFGEVMEPLRTTAYKISQRASRCFSRKAGRRFLELADIREQVRDITRLVCCRSFVVRCLCLYPAE